MQIKEVIAHELENLPQQKVAEVLDFVRFLRHQQEGQDALKAAETSLGKLWNTPEEDEAWKSL